MTYNFFLFTNEPKKLIIAKIKKTASNIFPISIEIPAKPIAPKIIESKAKTKKPNAARNIETPFHLYSSLI